MFTGGAAAAAEVDDFSCAEVGDTVGNTDDAEVGHSLSATRDGA